MFYVNARKYKLILINASLNFDYLWNLREMAKKHDLLKKKTVNSNFQILCPQNT